MSPAHARAPLVVLVYLGGASALNVGGHHRSNATVDEGSGLSWVFCAEQFMKCECSGKVRWGQDGHWMEIEPQQAPHSCDVKHQGDPHPGDPGKHCQCQVSHGSALWQRLSPAILPDKHAEKPVVSCDIMKAGASASLWGKKLWGAVEPLCTDQGRKGFETGPWAYTTPVTSNLMRVWVDPRFRQNYDRVYDEDGWVKKAFINYVGNSPSGQTYDRMMQQLFRSVHLFSSMPIVVVHFGMQIPEAWDPKRFPRLVVFHAAPLPLDSNKRSFNFNKYRAMLLARAQVGVELDSDQFVAPGVDAIFQRTEDEITEKYPMPILTAHFLQDKGPKGGGVWWPRYCLNGKAPCEKQTTRWGHAHPTWTFWALPHLGRWLRRNLLDETLPMRPGFPGSKLRVADVPEDEDLLNVALWEEGGTKQWCKFDTPDAADFQFLLKNESMDIGGDPRFYPHGVPLVYYTAHHAVNPELNDWTITELARSWKRGTLPPPISYKRRFYRNNVELRREHPNIECLI